MISRPWKQAGQVLRMVTAIALLVSNILAYQFYRITDEELRLIFLAYSLMLVFVLFPSKRGGVFGKVIDLLCIVLSGYVTVYLLFNYQDVFERVGQPLPGDIWLGVAAIVLVLEATRRSSGWVLTLLGLLFLLYPLILGGFLPGLLKIPSYGIDRVVGASYLSLNGILGVPLAVMIQYVFLFVVFGAFLEKFGATEFFIDLAKGLTGKVRGGSAKIATIASSFVGSVSGSAVANVMVTGVITIPMMKRAGFPPVFAAAVEAVASTGGQLLPPVMGASAFLMAAFTSTPYVVIMKYALLPALLYYLSVFLIVDREAVKRNLRGISSQEIPSTIKLLKKEGLFLLPLVILTLLMIRGFSPYYAVLVAIVLMAVVTAIQPHTRNRITWDSILSAIREAAESSVTLFVASATAGIVVGVVGLTGVGLKIGSLIMQASGGIEILALILTAVIALFFGMGLPTNVVYIMLSILVVPGLISLGVPKPAAHLFVLYYGMLSMITPPVCFASFAAARLAQTEMMRTGMASVRLGLVGLLLPFIFIYNPGLLLIGSWEEITLAIFKAVLSILSLTLALIGTKDNKEGFFIPRSHPFIRILFFLLSLILIPQSVIATVFAVIVFLLLTGDIILTWLKNLSRKSNAKFLVGEE